MSSRGRAAAWYLVDLAFSALLLIAWLAFGTSDAAVVAVAAIIAAGWIGLRVALGRAKAGRAQAGVNVN